MCYSINRYTEAFSWDNSQTHGNDIFLNGEHVGHKWEFWGINSKEVTFSTLHNLSEAEFEALRGELHWLVASENEDGGLTAECNSWQRFSVLLDTIEGRAIPNGELAR